MSTPMIYRGGDGDIFYFQGDLSAELTDVHAGSEVDVTVTLPEPPPDPDPEVDPPPTNGNGEVP